jgi:hypothetical protein
MIDVEGVSFLLINMTYDQSERDIVTNRRVLPY